MIIGKIKVKNMGFEFGCKNIVYVKNMSNNKSCTIIIPSNRMAIGEKIVAEVVLMFKEVSKWVGTESILNLPTMVLDAKNPQDQILTSSYFHTIRMSSVEKLKAIGLYCIDFEYAHMIKGESKNV